MRNSILALTVFSISAIILTSGCGRDIHSDNKNFNQMVACSTDIAFAKFFTKGMPCLEVSSKYSANKLYPVDGFTFTEIVGFSKDSVKIGDTQNHAWFWRDTKKDCILRGVFKQGSNTIKFSLIWKAGHDDFQVSAQNVTGELIQIKAWQGFENDPKNSAKQAAKARDRRARRPW